MRALIFGTVLLVAGPAFSGQAEDVAAKAAACWDLPAGIGQLSKAEFDVAIDDTGFVTDATVLDHKADSTATRVFVQSAVRALLKCSPYKGESGTIRLTMKASDIPPAKGPIDPFK
ncbi:hypothetical protein C7441_1108 [Pseudaminobacter salicylatoxidans]|uniref:TonB-like protein n=1 Tax=Pseudaminobacter salicylatoxidans TaxID=93369 RepID=A0A316C2A1_PSESE|nr:hypothetical protein [Pseudaminobacter salicylatoxidans]PWJ81477.1 hypothetical protein C7441_1108 [Pseudaminobacter salicylatoxidans]